MSDSATVYRRFTVFIFVGVLLLAGATLTKQAYGHLTGEIYSIQYSTSINRGNPNLLDGASVVGNIAVFTNPLFPLSDVKQVDFFLNQGNNPPGSTREIREKVAPYDYASTAADGTAIFLDTNTLADGPNRISMRVIFTDGHRQLFHADFNVANNPVGPPDYEFGVSELEDRSGAEPAMMVSPEGPEVFFGTVFIFLAQGDQCIAAGCPPILTDDVVDAVTWTIDKGTGSEIVVNTDTLAPFDLNGTNAPGDNPGVNNGFDMDSLPAGVHTLTADIELVAGGSTTEERSFISQPLNDALPGPLSDFPVSDFMDPQLDEGGPFIKDLDAAIALGRALFWEQQTGGDGRVACATCHYHSGVDNRILNTINPGPNGTFDAVAAAGDVPNADDYPYHLFDDPVSGGGNLVRSWDDITGSQGVPKRKFVEVNPGNPVDTSTAPDSPEAVFLDSNGDPRRQVTGRNTPTNINAIYNVRSFRDGRANYICNGRDPFGDRSPNAMIYRNGGSVGASPGLERMRITAASLCSQALGPPNNGVEMSFDGRSFPELGRKLLSLGPLALQEIHPQDSVFVNGPMGNLRNGSGFGLNTSYNDLIEQAFQDDLWNGGDVTIGGVTYSMKEGNFSVYWGLAIMLWEATLVSDQSPWDIFREGGQVELDRVLAQFEAGVPDANALLTIEETEGMNTFIGGGACIACHAGPVFTANSIPFLRLPAPPPEAAEQVVEHMLMERGEAALELGITPLPSAIYDLGFYNIGVRPTADDIGIAALDPWGNPLSFSAQLQSGVIVDTDLTNPASDLFVDPCLFAIDPCGVPDGLPTANGGAIQVPSLRNTELLAPHMRNGSMKDLLEVVQFYARGADFGEENILDLDPEVGGIGNIRGNLDRQNALVAFMRTFTDPRVAEESAPFDHPSIALPNGVVVAAVGENGNGVLPTFTDRLNGPTAIRDFYETGVDVPLVVTTANDVLENDVDGTGQTPTDAQQQGVMNADPAMWGPMNGTLTAGLNADGTFTYTPAGGFRGVDKFGYDMTAGGGPRSNVAEVTIQVGNGIPVAEPDFYEVVQDNDLVVPAPGVLDNDSDPENDALDAILVSGPSSGTLVSGLNTDGSFTYRPNGGFVGTDTFEYTADDADGPSASALVTITVNGATAGTPCPGGSTLVLCFSTSADRSNPLLLEGATVTGNIYVFVNPLFPTQAIRRVDFFLNETSNSSALRYSRENAAPYDFNGTAGGGDAVPYNVTTELSSGGNFIRAKIPMTDGSPRVLLRSDFTVN